jgi:TetR/AcrR family tetracycline transcriptional repressor
VTTKAISAKQATTPRVPLSRTRVFEAALRIVDADGVDALTMRRLGEELGADPMSVYRHVDGKDALLDGLSDTLWAEVPGPDAGAHWSDDLRAFARSVRAVFHRHPLAAPLMIRRFLNRSALEVSHAYLQALRVAGLADTRAAEVIRSLVSYSVGYGLQEVGLPAIPRTPAQSTAAGREFLVSLGQALPAGTPSYLVETAIALCADCNPDDCFEFGLELIVGGVRQFEPPKSRDRTSG